MTNRRRARLAGAVFGVVGAAFLVVTFVRSLGETDDAPIPDLGAIALAAVLASAGLALAGRGWTCLFPNSRHRPGLARAFYASQLGKYIPGGVWQPLGLVGLSGAEGVGVARTGTVLPVHVVTQTAGVAVVGAGVALVGTDAAPAIRIMALAGLVAPALLFRGWMRAFLERAGTWVGRDVTADIPSQRAILESFGWAVLTILAAGSSFAVLVRSMAGGDSFSVAVVGFALAWVVGFLAVPFPAGLGVREAVLLGVLASPTAAIVGAAVVHRLVTIVAEVLAIGVSRIWWRRKRGAGS